MIGWEQARAFGDNAVPVVVGIAGERNVEFIFQADQALHGIWRRRIHSDPAVPIDTHEPESWIDGVVHDRQIQAIPFGDCWPVVDPRATERVYA